MKIEKVWMLLNRSGSRKDYSYIYILLGYAHNKGSKHISVYIKDKL